MFTTKQILSSTKFSQATGETLTLSGATKLVNFTGDTSYLKVVKGTPNITFMVNDLTFAEDADSLLVGTYDSTFRMGGGFNSSPNVVTEVDGRLLFAGGMSLFNNIKNVNDIIILNNDETKYTSFNTGDFNQSINTVLRDGTKYILTGVFTTFSGVTTNRIVRLNADGSRDSSYTIGTGFGNTVNESVRQSDGKVIAVGSFTTYNGTTRNRIARINADGTLDTGFNLGSGFSTTPGDIILQADGKIVVGGSFTTFSGVSTNRIVRINSNGTRDSSFVIGSGFNLTVNDLAIQTDQKIIAVGSFSEYSGVTVGSIVRLNTDGSVDSTFNSGIGFNGTGNVVFIDSNGKILVGGSFTTYDGQATTLVCRLNTDGTLDSSFAMPAGFSSGVVSSITERSNGNYVITGAGVVGNIAVTNKRKFVVEVTSTGSIVTTFRINNTGFSTGSPKVIKPTSDNKILIGGDFTSYNDASSSARLIRINPDTSIDTSFLNGQPNNIVQVIAPASGETKLIVGGAFTQYGATTGKNRIVRLNAADGSLDNTFSVGTGFNTGSVYDISVLPDGKMYVLGDFTSFNSSSAPNIIRLNADGTKDNGFDLTETIFVYNGGDGAGELFGAYQKLFIQPSGKLVITGIFSFYNDQTARLYIGAIRYLSGGTVDNTWGYNDGLFFEQSPSASVMLPDGKLLVVGDLNTINGSGLTSNFIRLTVDGELDATFDSGSGFNNQVSILKLDSDGNIFAGGAFTQYKGVPCAGLVKIDPDGNIIESFSAGDGFSSTTTITINDITKYGSKYLVGGAFQYYQNELANNFLGISAGGSGYTIQSLSGIKYATDISTNLSDLSLTHKKYVDDLVDSKINGYTNGLTQTGTTVSLGGTLNKNTTINASSFDINITGTTGNFFLKDKKITLEGKSSTSVIGTKLVLSSTGTTFFDTTTGNSKGIKYGGNYISGLTDTTLVPKKFVTDLFIGTNGLSIGTGNTVNLGGVLTKDTVLSGDSRNFKIVANSFTSSTGIDSNLTHVNKNGVIDPNFVYNEGFDFQPHKLLALPDGKYMVGGYFRFYNGKSIQPGLARMNADGTYDTTFNSGGVGFNFGLSGPIINSIKRQADGKLIIAGQMSSYNGVNTSNLIRLNVDGSLDTTFSIPTSFGQYFDSTLFDTQVQLDGKIVAVGNFNQYSGQTYNKIIRLNSNGHIDNTFVVGTGFNSTAWSVVQQTDGKLIVGGNFSTYSGVTSNKLIRLHPNGKVDATYNVGTGMNQTIEGLTIQPDNKVIPHGNFSLYNGINVLNICRINTNGSLDGTFVTGASSSAGGKVRRAIVLPDQKILIGGDFSTYGATPNKNGLLRLNSNGTLDNTFLVEAGLKGVVSTSPYGLVSDILYFSGNTKILAVGGFTSFNDQIPKKFAAQFNNNGTIDTTYSVTKTMFSGTVQQIEKFDNNRFMLGGNFSYKDGKRRSLLVRMYSDGTIDPTFQSGTTTVANVQTIKVSPDKKILVATNSTSTIWSGQTVGSVFRLTENGVIDQTFKRPLTGGEQVLAAEILSNDKIILAGGFSAYSGVTKNRILRLYSDGGIDNTFTIGTGPNGDIYSLCVQSDGKLLIGGQFTTFNGTTRNRLARLNADGTLDTSFVLDGTGFDSTVLSIKIQSDGKIVVAGSFNTYNGLNYKSFIRLNSNGSVDTTFVSPDDYSGSSIDFLSIDKYDRITLAGSFTSYKGYAVTNVFRVFKDSSIDFSFSGKANLRTTSYPTGFGGSIAINGLTVTDDATYVVGSFLLYNDTSPIANLVKIGNYSDIVVDNSTAMKYSGDYSMTYTSRTLPDVAYVTGLTSTLQNEVQLLIVTATTYTATTLTHFVHYSGNTASTLYLPVAPKTKQQIIVSDAKGNAFTSNITVNGNGKLINGVSTAQLNSNYGSLMFVYNGINWIGSGFTS